MRTETLRLCRICKIVKNGGEDLADPDDTSQYVMCKKILKKLEVEIYVPAIKEYLWRTLINKSINFNMLLVLLF